MSYFYFSELDELARKKARDYHRKEHENLAKMDDAELDAYLAKSRAAFDYAGGLYRDPLND